MSGVDEVDVAFLTLGGVTGKTPQGRGMIVLLVLGALGKMQCLISVVPEMQFRTTLINLA